MPDNENIELATTEATVLREFLDSNIHRCYPLDTSTITAAKTPSTAMLVDALVVCTGAVNPSALAIGKAVFSSSSVKLALYYNNTILGYIADIPYDTSFGTVVKFHIVTTDPLGSVTGKLTIGDLTDALDTGVVEYGYAGGKFYTGCCITLSDIDGIHGIQVGNTLLTGIITFKEGSGITLTPKIINGQACIEISANDLKDITNASHIFNDDSLVEAAVNAYGTPIRSINGVYPVAENSAGGNAGNISIQAPSDSTCLNIEGQPGTGVITISNQCSEPCCGKEELKVVVDNIGVLNTTVARIEAFQKSLDTSLNTLSTQLTRLP